MADWPELDELKQVLDVDPAGSDWDTILERLLASAIERVKGDVGDWDDLVDVPDDNLAQAALRMAEIMAQKPEAAGVTVSDPTYARLVMGRRRRFAIS